jgi:hypothetical protein
LVPPFLSSRVDSNLAVVGDVVVQTGGLYLENHSLYTGGRCIVGNTHELPLPRAGQGCGDAVTVTVPSKLPVFSTIEAHDGAITSRIAVAHHAALIGIFSSTLSCMAKAKVVTDLMHLSTHIVAPLVVVHRQVAVDIRISNPRPCGPRRQAKHHVIERGGQSSKNLRECSGHCVPDDAVRNPSDSLRDVYLVDTICSTAVCSWSESELVVGTCLVLRDKVHRVASSTKDRIGNLSHGTGSRCIGRLDPDNEDGPVANARSSAAPVVTISLSVGVSIAIVALAS